MTMIRAEVAFRAWGEPGQDMAADVTRALEGAHDMRGRRIAFGEVRVTTSPSGAEALGFVQVMMDGPQELPKGGDSALGKLLFQATQRAARERLRRDALGTE